MIGLDLLAALLVVWLIRVLPAVVCYGLVALAIIGAFS